MKSKLKLFQPIEINGMKLNNRIAFAPMLNNPIGEGGFANDRTISWYAERAKGGAGMVATGTTSPNAKEWALLPRQLALYDDKFIPGLTRLAEAVHQYDTKLMLQLGILGPLAGIGPSPNPYPDSSSPKATWIEILEKRVVSVNEVSSQEIKQLVSDCGIAAARAKAAGVDCIELHSAHGAATLHCAFLSPFFNRRNDEYGGSWDRRLKFLLDTIREMRKAVGENFPILVRISSDELLGERGITLQDTTQIIVPALEKAGIDCLDVSQGSITYTPEGIEPPLYYPRGCFIPLTESVKKATRLPVIGVGRIVDLNLGEELLQQGKADIVFMLRQLISDPETPRKYFEGRNEDIRKCIGCLNGRCIPCTINYDTYPEIVPLTLADKPKKVIVIGGGVAGMEAARVAALRGHRVTLIERDSNLGGAVDALSLDPLTAEFKNIINYLTSQITKLEVDVRLNNEANAEKIKELNPDILILATGSRPNLPEFAKEKPGVMTHIEALRNPRQVGHKVVVWGFFGAELAISLADKGKDVTLIGKGAEGSLASDHRGARRLWILRKLTDSNFARATPEALRLSNPRVFYGIDVHDIAYPIISITDKDGKKSELEYDTLIISQRFGENQPNDSLFNELKGILPEVYAIGDCSKVRSVTEAIWMANDVSRRI
jgi:2,4-dienoyl-CoA reductase-like NADH-dependent reductase (Old Yellow Enzyme family)/thioredoxin reductase